MHTLDATAEAARVSGVKQVLSAPTADNAETTRGAMGGGGCLRLLFQPSTSLQAPERICRPF
jgi:hypothetical protein